MNVGGKKISMYELAKQTKENVEENHCEFPVPGNVTMNLDKLNNIMREVDG